MTQSGELWSAAESGLLRPKYDIASIVEARGIPVPRRFEGFSDAYGHIAEGGSVIIRSEHPEDYDGPSGLANSYVITPELIQNPENIEKSDLRTWVNILRNHGSEKGQALLDKMNRVNQFCHPHTAAYLKTLGRPIDEYFKDFGYSLWEYIPGTNITIVADDVVLSRYHCFASEGSIFSYNGGAVCNDGGEVLIGGEANAPGAPRGRVVRGFTHAKSLTKKSVETYEQVRDLYNSTNCPIMEFQVDQDGAVWFLQLKKGRDFIVQNDCLHGDDFDPRDGWIPAQAVRGATASEIISRPTVLYYSEEISHKLPFHPDFREPASMGTQYNIERRELLARRRDVWAVSREADYYYVSMAIGGHATKSEWLMPDVAMAFGEKALRRVINPKTIQDLEIRMPSFRDYERGKFTYILPAVVMQYASDGRQGFARQDPEYDEPVEINYSEPARSYERG